MQKGLFSIAFAASANAQPASKEAVQEILIKMGYEDIFISKCWINSARTIEPKGGKWMDQTVSSFY